MMIKVLARRLFPALLAALVVTGCAVNPVTREREFSLMSESQELQMGAEAYPVYTQASGGLFMDDELQAYVSEVGLKLARVSHRPGVPYEFNVVNDEAINAYALPGGKISITRGLLGKMENEAQMAAVLGHEVGHVTARHGAAGYTRQVMVGVVAAVGAVALEQAEVEGSELILGGGLLAANLVLMKYSRDQERQSDELGYEYMVGAGYNPQGMVETMQILDSARKRQPSALEEMLSSHPLTTERIEEARRRAASAPPALRSPERLYEARFMEKTLYLQSVAPAYDMTAKGTALFQEGKKAEGLKLLRQAANEAPDEAQIQVALAAAELEMKHLDEARAASAAAVRRYPGLFSGRVMAGLVEYEIKNYRAAVGHFDSANKIVPDQPVTAYYRGRSHEALGNRDLAANDYMVVMKGVKKGPMREYAASRLVEWGYARR